MNEKEHDRKCWNCEFDDFCSWTAAGEEDACGKWKAEERKSCRND